MSRLSTDASVSTRLPLAWRRAILLLAAGAALGFSVTAILGPARLAHRLAQGWGLARSAPMRGEILDRHGVVLATSALRPSLYADPSKIRDPQATAAAIVRVAPDLDEGELVRRLAARKRFVWIKRQMRDRQADEIAALHLPGVGLRREEGRIYPQGARTSHVVGFTNIDARGTAGVEAAQDAALSDKRNVSLTIDARIQTTLWEELSRAVDEVKAAGAAGVVLDARSGDILALVSLPDFEPAKPVDGADPHHLNRASLGVYELGDLADLFSSALSYEAADAAPDARASLARKLGLLERAPIGVAESAPPLLPANWQDRPVSAPNGLRGVAVTPVQATAAIAALVNGGTYRAPTLLMNASQPARQAVSTATSEAMRARLAKGLSGVLQFRPVSAETDRRQVSFGLSVIGEAAPRAVVYVLLQQNIHPDEAALPPQEHARTAPTARAARAAANVANALPPLLQ